MENIFNKNSLLKRRRELIPIWIKPFILLFLALGVLAIYGIGKNIIGIDSSSTIYGLESFTIFSILGVLLKGIILFKAITSYGLWMEKDWAITFGIIDAVFGIIVCVVVMVVLPFVDFKDSINELNIRFEIFLLIPYLVTLIKIKKKWENFATFQNEPSGTNKIVTPKIIIEEKAIVNNNGNNEIEYKTENIEIIDKEDPSRFMPK